MKEGVPGFMAALWLYKKQVQAPKSLDLSTFLGGRRDQNIPHRPAYPAGSAGYITLDRMNTVRGLALQVVWFDEHMLEFKLSAGNESFSGETHFYAALDEARSLADRIGGFPESPADLREYQLGGSGLPGYGGARIRLACKDRSGHLVVRVDVSTEHGPDLGTDSASVHFDAMPAAVDAFVDELRRMRVEVGQMARLSHAV